MAARSGSGTKTPKTSGSTAKKGHSKKSKPKTWKSRAVLRLIEAGSTAECPLCGERVKFRARHRDQQVICNVYEDSVWIRVEQYHADCYTEAGAPHGAAIKKANFDRSRSAAKAKDKTDDKPAGGAKGTTNSGTTTDSKSSGS